MARLSGQHRVLTAIRNAERNNDWTTVGTVSMLTGLNARSVTGICNALFLHGMIERDRDKLHITESGRRALSEREGG